MGGGRGSSQRGKHFVFRGLGGHERGNGVEAERGWKRGVSATLVVSVGMMVKARGCGRGTISCPAKPSLRFLPLDHASKTSRFSPGCLGRNVGGLGRNEPGCRERESE